MLYSEVSEVIDVVIDEYAPKMGKMTRKRFIEALLNELWNVEVLANVEDIETPEESEPDESDDDADLGLGISLDDEV